ncbi:MAG: hypothetical protein IJ293_06900 [Treponema sp.]|nr:hypothetical protein [Treponema sp.]
MKKNYLFLLILLTLFTSCREKIDLTLNYEVLINEDSPENLNLYTTGSYLFGIDPNTFDLKLSVKFNYELSKALYINDKIYLSTATHAKSIPGNSIWGYNLICLNKDLSLNREIPVHPNTTDMVQYENYLVTKTSCYTSDMYSGFAIVDLTTNECIYKCENLNQILNNFGQTWGYNNKFYLGNFPYTDERPFSISIFDLDKMDFEEQHSAKFCSKDDEYPWEYSSIYIYNNQLWINYYCAEVICVYDLDTYERLARIDLKEDYKLPILANESKTKNKYCMGYDTVIDGKYHVILREDYQPDEPTYNAILIIDTQTFELEKELKVEKRLHVNEIFYRENEPNSIYVRTYDSGFYKFDSTTGELLNKFIVFNPYSNFELD